MTSRRKFLIGTGAGIAALGSRFLSGRAHAQAQDDALTDGIFPAEVIHDDDQPLRKPVVVSTWNHGVAANDAAWPILATGGRALDAVETGVQVPEGDPEVQSVGYGGLPDREGKVTLDSCIMDELGNAGAVAFLQNIMHPIRVARLVMEETPHVMLVGEGASRFARENGFTEEDLLTDSARARWQEWLKKSEYNPYTDPHRPREDADHDTISMLALDAAGNLSGACTTSGLSYKMHGRVGDSPIIGAALFVDNEVGAACATGVGEEVMKTVGSFLIVELMRQGHTPEEACREGVARIMAKNPRWADVQVGYLALDKRGRVGSYAIQPWFQYALTDSAGGTRLLDSPAQIK